MTATQGIIEFLSKDTGIDRSEFALTVGFAHDLTDEDSDDAFLLERALEPGDDPPGDMAIYVEVPPQRYAMYGEIEAAELHRDRFELRLTPHGTTKMGGNRKFVAHFDLDMEEYDALRDALRFVFSGYNCYREIP